MTNKTIMKIVKLERPIDQQVKINIIDKIKDSKSFFVIFNNNELTYQWVNLSNNEIIAALELVKMDVLKEMV